LDHIIGLGWDVGGWLGKNHGIAAVEWFNEEIRWIYTPKAVRLPKCGIFTPDDFYSSDNTPHNPRVILGVDAPLGYPAMFQKLVGGGCPSLEKPEAEIDNGFAYRDTERYIYKEFKKKPLSATFDKLGNNASLAIMTTRRWWSEFDFQMLPSPNEGAVKHAIIEVYPALLKIKALSDMYNKVKQLIPVEYTASPDAYDAAICALLALGYGLAGKSPHLPKLIGPPANWNGLSSEGWIYYPSFE